MNIPHKQHYVQQKYLHNWEENYQLCVYDKRSKTGNIYFKGTSAICFERDYYKSHRLTCDEKRIFDAIYKDVPPTLKSNIDELNCLLDCEIEIESSDEKTKLLITEIFSKHRKEIESDVFTQFGETLLSDIENNLSNATWNKLFSGDETFIADEQDRVGLFNYILGQMWRVPSKKNKLKNVLEKLNIETGAEVSSDRMFPYFVYHQSMIEACYMSYYNKHKLVYLRIPNNLKNEFITADNPVINLCKEFDSDGSPKTYNLYWAITPKLALIVTENQFERSRVATNEDIQYFNKLIFDNATRYVISHYKEDILRLVNIQMKSGE